MPLKYKICGYKATTGKSQYDGTLRFLFVQASIKFNFLYVKTLQIQ